MEDREEFKEKQGKVDNFFGFTLKLFSRKGAKSAKILIYDYGNYSEKSNRLLTSFKSAGCVAQKY